MIIQTDVTTRMLAQLAHCLDCTTAFAVAENQDAAKILVAHGLGKHEEAQALDFAVKIIQSSRHQFTEEKFGKTSITANASVANFKNAIGIAMGDAQANSRLCICVADNKEREFSDSDRQLIFDFASFLCFPREQIDAADSTRESERRTQAIIESALDCIIFMDSKGIITKFNPAAEQTFGFSANEIVGKKLRDTIVPPEYRDAHDQGMNRYLQSKKHTVIGKRIELPAMKSDGTRIDVELTITETEIQKDTIFVAYLRDITQLKAEQKKNKRLLAEFQSIFELSPDGFVAFSDTGRVTYLNPAMSVMFGVDRDQIRDLSEHDFDSFVRERSIGNTGQEYSDSNVAETDDVIMLTKPEKRYLKKSVRNLSDYSGDVRGKVAYFRDITHEFEVNEAKSEFLSTAAHELRTPMASIFGFTELLLKRDFDDATRRDLLETIHRQTTSLMALINELLDLARIEAKRGKDFRPVAQPIVPLIQRTIQGFIFPGDSRKVTMKLPRRSPEVNVDTDKFSQALINVVSNAYKYSPNGGEISLHVSHKLVDGQGWVTIKITDSGLGMTPEQVVRVFERFYRADTSGKIAGTGLGMSLVKEICELQGGRVAIESEIKRGTQVTIWLPECKTSSS